MTIKHKTFLGKEFLIATTTSKVTHATQEDKIIQRIRTFGPKPTPHNQPSYMNQVQIEYQDHKTFNERYPPQVKNHMSKVHNSNHQ